MFKMFFQYEPGREADDLVRSLSLLFLTPVSSISAEDVWATGISRKRKIENLSINELPTYTVCRIKGVPSMTVVDFKKPFNSDNKFIDSFKENYLGTVKAKVTKAELVKLAMIDLDKHDAPMLLQVHDELLFEVDAKDAFDYAEWLKVHVPAITEVNGIQFPIEVSVADNWLEASK